MLVLTGSLACGGRRVETPAAAGTRVHSIEARPGEGVPGTPEAVSELLRRR